MINNMYEGNVPEYKCQNLLNTSETLSSKDVHL